jgi:hypothetical protein
MKNFYKIIGLLSILSLFLFITGCQSMAVSKAQNQMQTTFEPLMGHSEEDVVMQLGAPSNVQHLGELTVYHYYQSYGVRSKAYANTAYSSGYGHSKSWESYDQAEIVFKDGRAVKWKGYVQR